MRKIFLSSLVVFTVASPLFGMDDGSAAGAAGPAGVEVPELNEQAQALVQQIVALQLNVTRIQGAGRLGLAAGSASAEQVNSVKGYIAEASRIHGQVLHNLCQDARAVENVGGIQAYHYLASLICASAQLKPLENFEPTHAPNTIKSIITAALEAIGRSISGARDLINLSELRVVVPGRNVRRPVSHPSRQAEEARGPQVQELPVHGDAAPPAAHVEQQPQRPGILSRAGTWCADHLLQLGAGTTGVGAVVAMWLLRAHSAFDAVAREMPASGESIYELQMDPLLLRVNVHYEPVYHFGEDMFARGIDYGTTMEIPLPQWAKLLLEGNNRE